MSHKRCIAKTKKGKRCKNRAWHFGDSVKCKVHTQQELRRSDKFSIRNYRATINPSKWAAGGLGANLNQAIEL